MANYLLNAPAPLKRISASAMEKFKLDIQGDMKNLNDGLGRLSLLPPGCGVGGTFLIVLSKK